METNGATSEVEKNLSFTVATGKTHVNMVKAPTASIAVQTGVIWTKGEDKYKKISDLDLFQNTNI